MAKTNRILRVGETISWTFDDDEKESTETRGKTFKAKISMVDKKEENYGVYASYGQDLIPFDDATLLKS